MKTPIALNNDPIPKTGKSGIENCKDKSTRQTGWKEKDDRTIKEIRDYLEQEKLDAFIPWKPAHLAYLTNYYDVLHMTISWEEMTAIIVIPRGGEASIIGAHEHFAGCPEFGVAPWWLSKRIGGYDLSSAEQTFCETINHLKKIGLSKGRIGIERKWIPLPIYEHFCSALPHVEFVSADLLIPQIRLVKNKRELKLLSKAGKVGILCMETYMNAIRRGATRREAEIVRAQKALEYGAEWTGGASRVEWTGGLDDTPAWWDAPARQRWNSSEKQKNYLGIADNSPFLIHHYETRFQYYWADHAWNQFYGAEPNDSEILDFGASGKISYGQARQNFDVMRQVQKEAINQIRAGMDQIQAKAAIDKYFQSNPEAAVHMGIDPSNPGGTEHAGMYFIHSIGIEIHEEPVIASRAPRPVPLDGLIYIRPGTVLQSEWLGPYWTVEEPFVLRETGVWEPLVELVDIIAVQ